MAILLVAGCTEPLGLAAPLAPEAADGPAEPAPPASLAAPTALDPMALEFAECVGAATIFTFPAGLGPGEPIPGWPGPPPTASNVELRFAQCERMRWGPFERPITLMYEMHDRQSPPPGCTSDKTQNPASVLVLHALWLDDAEVAAWANLTFGMPTRVATFTVDVDGIGRAATATWRWELPGGEASEVTFAHANPGNLAKQTGTYLQRMAWLSGGVLHLLGFHETMQGDRVQGALTPGTMGPTMLYRQAAPETYLGHGDRIDKLGLTGEIHRFEDLACADPL